MGLLELNGWHGASLVAFLPMLACSTSGGEDAGFRITSIAYDAQNRLVLNFSEPIVDPSGIDPADFRLSRGQTSQFVIPGMPVQQLTFYGGLGYGGFAEVAPGDSPDQLVLTLAYAIDFPDYCQNIEYYLAYYEDYFAPYLMQEYPGATASFDMAMFLHYAAGDIPIESELGETIADVMPDFVLSDGYVMPEMRFGFMNYLRIPCP